MAVFDNSSRAILVYDMSDSSVKNIPSQSGGNLALSPDGTRLVFPRLIYDDANATTRSVLQMADLVSGSVADLIDESEPVDDTESVWHPDGERLVIARRYTDERATETRQLYLLDTRSTVVEPLVNDFHYYNGFFSWDPLGQSLVIQRFPQYTDTGDFNPDGRPEIWTYDMAGDTLTLIAQNAYLPRWIP